MWVNRPNRMLNYSYSNSGMYFITIVLNNRIPWFGEIQNGKMVLNDTGEIAREFFVEIPDHFKYCFVDEFIIMPDHMHGVVGIMNDVEQIRDGITSVGVADLRHLQTRHLQTHEQPIIKPNHDRTKMKLSKIIHGYKSSVTRKIRADLQIYSFKWQRSFYDRIIRNEDELYRIQNYIRNNVDIHESRKN